MSAVARFDPAEPIAAGRTVIEASAGTGKTFTIAAHVTRLVAEEDVPLERILVVTFTRAATAELRDRIRRRMVDTLHALEGTGAGIDVDEHMKVILDVDGGERTVRVVRLTEALTRFDRAQIFTIHGFAYRILDHLGFHARLSSDLEPAEIDERLISSAVADVLVERFADDATGIVAARDLAAIARTVTTNPDARIVPESATASGESKIRSELATRLRTEVDRRLRAAGLVAYDRFLIEVRDALRDPANGAAARRMLRDRFTVALVDECQDTDRIQWQVIHAVFDESRLLLIGDPKQSIYAFRGADLESYLVAVDGADTRRTLLTNWRSDGPLITALDALFEGATFGDRRIGYRRVDPALEHRNARITGAGSPLSVRRFDRRIRVARNTRSPRGFSKPAVRETVAADVAAEAVRLLMSGVEIHEGDESRPVGPGDIAVLCRTRKQVQLVQRELDRRGVPSVAARSGGVFASHAAEQWRRFLHGVERPDRNVFVRLAATSDLVGMSLAEMAALDDESAIALQNDMRTWRELLYSAGVPALLSAVDRHTNMSARILGAPEGERHMTDLAHVAEAMHAVWRRGRVGSLVGWLEGVMAEAVANDEANIEEPESRQRRLETDADAIQVQTIHGAKGLEYPIVLCPFLWDRVQAPPGAVNVPVFHDPAHGERSRLVDVGGEGSQGFAEHKALAEAEEDAEEGRLLYVAMTRAKHHLVVWWIEEVDGAASTKLHDILTLNGSGDDLGWLILRSDETISEVVVADLPAVRRYQAAAGIAPDLHVAAFARPLDYLWQRASFSSLSPDHPVASVADTAEDPVRIDEADEADDTPQEGATPLPMAALPRGWRFGTLVHRILERVAFDASDLETVVSEAVDDAVARFSWDLDVAGLVAGLMASLRTPLGPEPDAARLCDIPDRRSLKEMVFEFPVRDTGSSVSVGDIAAVMLEHLPEGDPHRRYAERLGELPPQRFRGYLTGAIDYTAAVPGPEGKERFVVMDFKSNALPTLGEEPAATDYAPARLGVVMADGHYLLQALLYQVALHRYLQWRLPGYDPATHLGGSANLFVRGMAGPGALVIDGGVCGVYRWLPPPEMIVDLSRRFAIGDSS